MILFLAFLLPAVIAAITAYSAARTKSKAVIAWTALFTVNLLYSSLPAILIQRGTTVQPVMLLDHLVALVLLAVVGILGYAAGYRKK